MSDDTTVYIYTLSDPDTGEVRYVGQTIDLHKRYRWHLYTKRKTGQYRHHWIQQLRGAGKKPVQSVIEITTSALADERERHWIAKHRVEGARLTNLCDGGQGPRGFKWSAEYREWRKENYHKWSAALSAGKARFSDEEVRAIHDRLNNGEEATALAREYGVNRSAISAIGSGRHYKHLNLPPVPKRRKGIHMRRFSENEVRNIRLRFARGDAREQIALDYGISRYTLYDIVKGVTYSDVATDLIVRR